MFSEAALAGGEVGEGGVEVLFGEVRPEGGGDPQLGVADLPEEEVGKAQLAGSADEQVGVRRVGGVEVAGKKLGRDVRRGDGAAEGQLRKAASRGGDLLAGAVGESEREVQGGVVGSRFGRLAEEVAEGKREDW